MKRSLLNLTVIMFFIFQISSQIQSTYAANPLTYDATIKENKSSLMILKSNLNITIYLDEVFEPTSDSFKLESNLTEEIPEIINIYLLDNKDKLDIKELVDIDLLSINNEGSISLLNKSIQIDITNSTICDGNKLKIEVLIEKEDRIYHLIIIISLTGGKLEGIDILLNDKRRKIYEYICSNLGAYFREIMKKHNFSPGLTQYHLNTLEDHGYIYSIRIGKYKIYFSTSSRIEIDKARIHILLQNKNIKKIIKLIDQNPGISITKLSEKTKLHRNTINYNLNKLVKLGVVKKLKSGRRVFLYISQMSY